MNKKTAIVIGAGIVGLSAARALAKKGYQVTVIDKSPKALGATIRNFGMVWPIGQPAGQLYERALRSRAAWKEIAQETGMWFHECGSLHLAYADDEWEVMQELYELFREEGRPVKLLSATQSATMFNLINESGLRGGLYSASEMIVDPRMGAAYIAKWLEQKYAVRFLWERTVTATASGKVIMGEEVMKADIICICSGAEFESLYPDLFKQVEISKCRLQMMRYRPASAGDRIGTSLCGALSLLHYKSFQVAGSLEKLNKRLRQELPAYLENGIHVMVSQHGSGEFTIGDSHEYGTAFEPFDKQYINELIFSYLGRFVQTEGWQPVETWNGIYAKMTNGNTELFLEAEEAVYIINGLGGAGMTLSFGLLDELSVAF